MLCKSTEKQPYPKPSPLNTLLKFVDGSTPLSCKSPSRHIRRMRARDRYILPGVKMLTKGPSSKKPSTIPVHRAQSGSCTPRIKNDLSLI